MPTHRPKDKVMAAAASSLDVPTHEFEFSPHLKANNVTLKDFVLIKVLGKGSFGKVMLVRKRDSGGIFAMKVLEKENIIRRNQVEHTRTERSVLGCVKNRFIVRMRFAFQTTKKLYFVLDYCPGGELFFHLGRAGRFTETRARFYTAQIIIALEYLHDMGVIYRDLKPENVLLDSKGNVKLTDFGLSKTGIMDNTSASSFCGTPEYLAPEILQRSGHGRAADWWSLGALVYEMLIGMPPFYSRSRERLFTKILKCTPRIPTSLSQEAQHFILSLLERNMEKRLGTAGDAAEVKTHPFFRGVDWEAVAAKRVPPPWRPHIGDIMDTNNFEAEFTNMPISSVDDKKGTKSHLAPGTQYSKSISKDVAEGKFAGFTYDKGLSPSGMTANTPNDLDNDMRNLNINGYF